MLRANVIYGRLGSITYQYPRTTVNIWDTGSSFGLTQLRSDYIEYVNCNITVKGFTKVDTVIDIGTTIYKFVNANGKDAFLSCISYHL